MQSKISYTKKQLLSFKPKNLTLPQDSDFPEEVKLSENARLTLLFNSINRRLPNQCLPIHFNTIPHDENDQDDPDNSNYSLVSTAA